MQFRDVVPECMPVALFQNLPLASSPLKACLSGNELLWDNVVQRGRNTEGPSVGDCHCNTDIDSKLALVCLGCFRGVVLQVVLQDFVFI